MQDRPKNLEPVLPGEEPRAPSYPTVDPARRTSSWFDRRLAALSTWGRRVTREPFPSALWLCVSLLTLLYAAAAVALRVWYEALGPYNVDTTVYWTVGHGIVRGLTPYLDLHETKPPGIFLLSALSYALTGDGRLTHVTQVVAVMLVAFAPAAYFPRLLRVRPLLPALSVFLALWTIALEVTTFAADYACEVQTEMHGLAGTVLYMVLLGKRHRLAFLGRALGILAAIGMKEPFVLLLPPVYWLLSRESRSIWDDLLGPLLLATSSGTAFLLATGWLSPYVGIYLRSMVSGHIQMHTESVWSRGILAIELNWNELKTYSTYLPTTLIYAAGVFLFAPREEDHEPSPSALVLRFQTLFLSVFLAGMAVGLGGHFYGHHFVFATPFHLAILFALMIATSEGTGVKNWIRPGLVGLAFLCVAVPKWVAPSELRLRLEAIQLHDREAHESARVIDAVLDRLSVERYLWLGHPGWTPLPFTRHLPLGPLFFQQVMFFEGRFDWLSDQFMKRLHEASVLVFAQHMTGPFEGRVKRILKSDFEQLPENLLPKNTYFPYQIFVRKGLSLPTESVPER